MVSLRKSHLSSSSRHELTSEANGLILAIFESSCVAGEFGKFGIIPSPLFVFVFAGMTSVRPIDIFVDLDPLFANSDIGKMLVDPGSTIEIVDSMLVLVQGGVGVAAENTRRLMVAGMAQCAVGNLLRQALPACAQPVEK